MGKHGKHSCNLLRVVLLGTTALVLMSSPDAAARVGVTSATDGDPLGKPPAENERILRIGIDVQANEIITTRANDRAHLVFLDGTSLTVGPNAQLTIDKFVFDPASKTGDLAITAGKGVFRLVGGKISKTKPITITTPSSTIGIRGGITLVNVQPNQTTSTFIFGNNMTVTGQGQTQNVTRPGSQVTTNAGAPPSQPTLVGQGALSGQMAQLEGTGGGGQGGGGQGGSGQGGGQGGGTVPVSFSQQNSGQGTSVGPAATGPTTSTTQAGQINNTNTTNAISNTNTQQQEQQAAQEAAKQDPPPPPPPPTTVIVSRGRFLRESPYVQGSFNNSTLGVTPNPQNNTTLMPTAALANGQATFTLSDGRSVTLPFQSGAIFQVSVTDPLFGPLNGFGLVSANNSYFAYLLLDGQNKEIGIVGGTPTTMAQFPTSGFAQHVLVNLGALGAVPFANDKPVAQFGSYSTLMSAFSSNLGESVGGAAPGPQRAVSLQASINIDGQGSSQQSYMGVFIGDYFRDYNNNTVFSSGTYNATYREGATDRIGRQVSAASTFDTGGGNAIFGPGAESIFFTPDGLSTSVTATGGIITSASTTRTPQASFDQPYDNLSGSPYFTLNAGIQASSSATTPNSRTDQTLSGFVGGIAEKKVGSSNTFQTRTFTSAAPSDVQITTSATNNRVSATIVVDQWDGQNTSGTFRLGGTSGSSSATSAFIDDRNYALRDRPESIGDSTTFTVGNSASGAGDVQSRTVMVSADVAPVPSFWQQQGVTPCTCEYLTWGWWSGDIRYNAGSSLNAEGRDRLNLATYVAGTLTSLVQLPTTGYATYTGHAVGNVVNGGNAYVAAGTYTNAWNFATKTGAVAISNFDGATYSGNTALVSNTVQFTGDITGAGRTGAVNGAFFNAPGTPAAYQAGNFAISGSGYQAAGTFAAQK
jgi:hypothetical protein